MPLPPPPLLLLDRRPLMIARVLGRLVKNHCFCLPTV